MNRAALKPIVFPIVIGLAGALVLIWLGTWQVQRLTWKQGILHDITARISADPVGLPADPDVTRDRYLPVKVSGQTAGREIHVLVSQKVVGAGYRVISAFETGDRRILLDQGFLLLVAKDQLRENVSGTVLGNLHWPDEIDSYTPTPDMGRNIWFARDVTAMAAELDTEPVLVIARTPLRDSISPLPVNPAGIANDHLQYAITWFSLAVIWLGMTGLWLWRNRTRGDDAPAS